MTRTPVTTRQATPEDVPALVDLWAELLRAGAGSATVLRPGQPAGDVGVALVEAMGRPDVRVLVATVGDEPVGMAVLTVGPLGPLTPQRAVQLHHVVVRDGFRRRGAGHALLAAAATYAEQVGVDHVLVGVYPAMREASRFYARMGFAPLAVRRVATVPVLRRQLAADRRRFLDDALPVGLGTRARLPLARRRAAARSRG